MVSGELGRYDSPLEMIVYTTFQEFATGLNYRNLRNLDAASGDVALDRMLVLLSQDETAHFQFFKEGVCTFMEQKASLRNWWKTTRAIQSTARDWR